MPPIRIRLTESNFNQLIDKAVSVLNQGGLIIYPTDTCYGAGVDSLNVRAVDKLLAFKGKRGGKPTSVMVGNLSTANLYVNINPTARFYYNHYLPGPFTIISKDKGLVDKRMVSRKKTLGIRIPNTRLSLKLSDRFNRPITATSANQSNKPSPYSIDQLLSQTSPGALKLIDLIIDAGQLSQKPTSTIIDTTTPIPTLLRSLRRVFKIKAVKTFTTNQTQQTLNAGQSSGAVIANLSTNKPVVILISGIMGAGKTHFVKGLADFLGVKTIVRSASFNLVQEYRGGKFRLIHTDLWRITSKDPVKYLDLPQFLQTNNWLVIEWQKTRLNPFYQLTENVDFFFVDIEVKNQHQRQIYLYQGLGTFKTI